MRQGLSEGDLDVVKTIVLPERDIQLETPLGGLVRKYAIQKWGVFTSGAMSNVRARNLFNTRTMLGSRSGLIQHDKITTSNPYTFINDVDYLKNTSANFAADNFDQPALNTIWSAPLDFGSNLPSVANGYAYADANDSNSNSAACRAKPSGIDLTAQYKIRVFVVPYKGSFGGYVDLHAGLNDGNPNTAQDGVRARFLMTNTTGGYQLNFSKVINGSRTTATSITGSVGVTKAGWFELWVTGDFTSGAVDVSAYWQGVLLDAQTYNISAGSPGNKLGFGLQANGGSNRVQLDNFRIQYSETSSTNRVLTQLVCASNGSLYRETSMNSLIALSSGYSLATDRTLQTQQRAQKLYIADNKIVKRGTDGYLTNLKTQITRVQLTHSQSGGTWPAGVTIGTVTLTFSAHTFTVGMKINVNLFDTGQVFNSINGIRTITAVTATTITFLTTNPIKGTSSVTSGSKNIVGVGTVWNTAGHDKFFAASNTTVYVAGQTRIIDTVGSDTTAASTVNFSATAANQILYLDIPDQAYTGGYVTAAAVVFDSAASPDWTTFSLNVYDYALVIESDQSTGIVDNGFPATSHVWQGRSGLPSTIGTYTLSSIAATKIVLTTSAAANDNPGPGVAIMPPTPGLDGDSYGPFTYSIQRTPKVYDPSADTLTQWATENTAPTAQTVSGITITSGLAVVTTSVPHLYQVGDKVTLNLTGLNQLYNGSYTITAATALTFSVEINAEDITARVAPVSVYRATVTGTNLITLYTRPNSGYAAGQTVQVNLNPANTVFDGLWTLVGASGAQLTITVSGATNVDLKQLSGTVSVVSGTVIKVAAPKGSIPIGCSIVALYRDRMVLAGAMNAAHMMFASRSGYPLDFDFTGDGNDPLRAYSGQETPQAGLIGKTITMLASWTDDYLLVGCKDSLWLQRGDLAAGGDIGPLSRSIGVISRDAWCKTPDGHFVFLSQDGLYGVPPGFGQPPASISRERLPFELLNINTDNYNVLMAFDLHLRGIHIYLTPSVAGNATTGVIHWFFDWENKSFWPTTLMSSNYDPTAVFVHTNSDPFDSGVLLGCRDGKMRQFRDACESDEGVAITSNCAFGPIRLWNQWEEGLLREIIATMATGSGSTTLSVYTGESEQAAYDSTTVFDSATLSAGRNYPFMPRMRGGAAKVVISNTSTRAWAMEALGLKIVKGGRQKATV